MLITLGKLINPASWPWKHFTPDEFRSRSTGQLIIETEFLDRLDALRSEFGRPMAINSGYRTPDENAAKSPGTGKTGPHTTGRACDVKIVGGADRFELVALAIKFGFTGIGIAKTFVHLDDVPRGHERIPRPAVWTY